MTNKYSESAGVAAFETGRKIGQAEAWKKIGDDPIAAAHEAGRRAGKSAVGKVFRELCGFGKVQREAMEQEAKTELLARIAKRATQVAEGDVKLDA